MSPDAKQFPNWNSDLRAAMHQEATSLFAYIIAEDRSLLEFIDAPYTFLNQPLAEFYGIDGVQGDEFRRVDLPADSPRGGVITLAAVLTVTSNPDRTSPVKRGKWILENILGTPPPPPPPDVPTLAAHHGGKPLATVRQQMEQHRADPRCASCHSEMDPLGFGLENFDAIGAWRDRETVASKEKPSSDSSKSNKPAEPPPIDASGKLPDGRTFNGPAELKKILLDKRDMFCRAFTQKMLTYALGRGTTETDDPADRFHRRLGRARRLQILPPHLRNRRQRSIPNAAEATNNDYPHLPPHRIAWPRRRSRTADARLHVADRIAGRHHHRVRRCRRICRPAPHGLPLRPQRHPHARLDSQKRRRRFRTPSHAGRARTLQVRHARHQRPHASLGPRQRRWPRRSRPRHGRLPHRLPRQKNRRRRHLPGHLRRPARRKTNRHHNPLPIARVGLRSRHPHRHLRYRLQLRLPRQPRLENRPHSRRQGNQPAPGFPTAIRFRRKRIARQSASSANFNAAASSISSSTMPTASIATSAPPTSASSTTI